jgi:cytochrome c biogenesis protein
MAAIAKSRFRKIWETLSAIKTGVILLIITVIVSATGTLILQRPNAEPEEMRRAYSPQTLRILDGLGLTDIYHAWWFVLLLLLVSVTIVAASIQRFPNSWRFFSRPCKSPNDGFRKTAPLHRNIQVEDEETGILVAARVCRKHGFDPELVTTGNKVSLFAERNRFSEMAVYVVHASLLLIFLGGIIDGIYGWRGFVTLTPGQQVSQVPMRNGVMRILPFGVRCDSAGQENYADGSPKRWWSKLAVIEEGRELQRKEIVVNDPLVYHGVRFYQASYGMTGKVDKIVFTATPADGKGSPQEIALSQDETIQLDPETSVHFAEFIPDYVVGDNHVYTRSASVQNPAVHLVVNSRKNGNSVNVWLPPIEGFAENSLSPYRFQPQDLKMGYFTGLEVSHEPGQWGVWAGVILMGIGLGVVFYVAHTRLWVVPVRDDHGKLVLWMGGSANRNREVFSEQFDKLVQEIQSQLDLESAARPRIQTTSFAGH